MEPIEWIAQGLGIAGMCMNVISYQQKTVKGVVTFQFFGSFLFVANYYLLGAVVGALLNLIASFRAIVFMNKERFHADKPVWLWVFGALYVLSYILSFTLFGSEPTLKNLLVEVLPLFGMMLTTISFQKKEAKKVRLLAMINSPFWLSYNLITFTIGGIIAELFSLTSILIGMFRFDRKKKQKEV